VGIINKIFGGIDEETAGNLIFTNYIVTFKNETIDVNDYPELKALGLVMHGKSGKILHANMSIEELTNKICQITGLTKDDFEVNHPFKLL